jgi:hypothetical protein
VYNSNGVLVLKGTTDANGYFTSYSCTGNYKVRVNANGYNEYGEAVTVSAGGINDVKADLQPSSPWSTRR